MDKTAFPQFIHVTRITNTRVYGHDVRHCNDPNDCIYRVEYCYESIDPEDVEVGHFYELFKNGQLLAEVGKES